MLHWLYGGGYFFGAKEWAGYPAALLNTLPVDEEAFVIVHGNYRLGPMGWVSAPGLDDSVDINVGLYDALAALEWTRQYIALFGGNPEKVTAMGQSAGAAIIEHLMAADVDGTRAMPFQQVMLSSPGWRPHVQREEEMRGMWAIMLNRTGCDGVECLRGLSEAEIVEMNRYMLQDLPSGGFPGPGISFGPVLDGDVVSDVPDQVLNATREPSGNVKRVIVGGMQKEGVATVIGDPQSWEELLKFFARTPSNQTITDVEKVYGPFQARDPDLSIFNPDGTVTALHQDVFDGDIIFGCHGLFADRAWSKGNENEAYRYVLSVPPALHGQDLLYYFFGEWVPALDPTMPEEAAREFQFWLRRFIRREEMSVGEKAWMKYGEGEGNNWINITADGLKTVEEDDEDGLVERCEFLLGLLGREEDGW